MDEQRDISLSSIGTQQLILFLVPTTTQTAQISAISIFSPTW